MRYKKRALIARRNKILPIQFIRQDMTTFSGLALIDHYLRLYRIHHRLKMTIKEFKWQGDYCVADILFVLLIMLLIGADRLQHIDYLRSDPLFKRVVRLVRIPHRTKLSTVLKQFSSDSLKALTELNSKLVIEQLTQLGLKDLTIDLDGTVISTKGEPGWAFKGYNPIKRGAKSYFPLTAHIAQTGHFLNIINRPGNVHGSNRALSLVKTISRQLAEFGLCFRADSAFCVPDLLNYLLNKGIGFAIKAPFWKLKHLKQAAELRRRWFRINEYWQYFWVHKPIDSVTHDHYVLILRKKVSNPKKPYQLKLFSPNNGVFEYSAVVTDNKSVKPQQLLDFVCGRSAQENSIGELKNSFAFDTIATNSYQANSAYMQTSQLAYNLATSMQHTMGLATINKSKKKSTRLHRIMKWKTFRFLILNRAGKIGWNAGKKVLQMTENTQTEKLYRKISCNLEGFEMKNAA